MTVLSKGNLVKITCSIFYWWVCK